MCIKKLHHLQMIVHHLLERLLQAWYVGIDVVVTRPGKRLHHYGKSTCSMGKSTINGNL